MDGHGKEWWYDGYAAVAGKVKRCNVTIADFVIWIEWDYEMSNGPSHGHTTGQPKRMTTKWYRIKWYVYMWPQIRWHFLWCALCTIRFCRLDVESISASSSYQVWNACIYSCINGVPASEIHMVTFDEQMGGS